jgi:hypothetical protein
LNSPLLLPAIGPFAHVQHVSSSEGERLLLGCPLHFLFDHDALIRRLQPFVEAGDVVHRPWWIVARGIGSLG